MANSTGTHSYGTTLGLDPAGGTSYTTVAEVIEINGEGVEVSRTKMSNLTSPNAYHEKRPGFADAGQVTFKCTWTKAQYSTFLTNIRTALMAWKVTFPLVGAESVPSTWACAGHLSKLGFAVPEDDRITNDVTVDVSGKPTFTSGT